MVGTPRMTAAHHPHTPVLLAEVLAELALRPDGIYVDGTFGRGGHSAEILSRLGPHGRLIAFDKDPEACAHAWKQFGRDPRFRIERGSFTRITDVLGVAQLNGRIAGILLDLGVSSPQLDDASRGFSFARDGVLDMRMDPQSGVSAAEWLAQADEREIADVLWTYGEERDSRRIARRIVQYRAEAPLRTTRELAELIAHAVPRYGPPQRIHPATRSFQALRIFLNRELDDLRAVLPQCFDALAPAGRLAVISFHSLEDRLVKRFMRAQAQPPQSPVPGAPEIPPGLKLCGKPIHAGDAEVAANPRARSAVLRVAEKL